MAGIVLKVLPRLGTCCVPQGSKVVNPLAILSCPNRSENVSPTALPLLHSRLYYSSSPSSTTTRRKSRRRFISSPADTATPSSSVPYQM